MRLILAIFLTVSVFADASVRAHRRAHIWAEKTVLLLHFDGADAATSATDVALGDTAPHTVAFVDNAQIDTAQSKFGGASLLLDGNGDYVDVANSPDFNFGSSDFTVELQFRLGGAGTNTWQELIGMWAEVGGGKSWLIGYDYNTTTLYFATSADGSSQDVCSAVVSLDGFVHLAGVRDGSTLRLFVNGTSVSTAAVSGSIYADTVKPMRIGARNNAALYAKGHIDEVRISDVARYTANFTPRQGPFQAIGQ